MHKLSVVISLALTCLISPQLIADDWREYRSETINVYSNLTRPAVLKLIEDVERAGPYLAKITGFKESKAPLPVTMYLFRSQAEFRNVIGARQILGVYRSTLGGGRSATTGSTPIDKRKLGGRQVVLHEFAHHYLAQLSPLNYPVWYIEGFADIVSTIVYSKKKVRIGAPLIPRITPLNDRKSWAPLPEILYARNPDIGKRGEWRGRDRFYAQSWLLAHMVQISPKFQAGRDDFLNKISSGVNPLEAIESSFNMTRKQFESNFSNHWKGGQLPFVEFKTQPFSEPTINIRSLNKNESEAIGWRAQLDFAETRERHAELIIDIHGELSNKDNPELRVILSEALLAYERPDKAGAQIDLVLAKQPNHAAAKFLRERINIDIAIRRLEALGEDAIKDYDFASIKSTLQKILYKNRDDSHALYMMGLTHFLDPTDEKGMATTYLKHSLELLPQNNEVRLMLAKSLIKDGAFDGACTALNYVKIYAKLENIKRAAIKEASWLSERNSKCD